jgi:hypothetical protein
MSGTYLDPYIPTTPEQDLTHLQMILLERAMGLRMLENYFIGNHGHHFSTQRFEMTFGRQLRQFHDNWMRLSIETKVNRLKVQGFRLGPVDTADTSTLNNRAWEIWRSNRMPTESVKAHREAMKFGTSYILVDPIAKSLDGKAPLMTVQSPVNVYCLRDPNNHFRVVKALKRWIGADDGYIYCTLYYPEQVFNYKSTAPVADAFQQIQYPVTYKVIGEVDNPLGYIPMIPLENQPTLIAGGTSDLDDIIPLQDALNKTLKDALVAVEFQSFRQRWATGVEIPKDPNTGQPIKSAQLEASLSRLWAFESPDTKVGDFSQVDLTGYTSIIELLVQQIVAVSNMSSTHLISKLANLSADAVRAAELGFTDACKTKCLDYGVSWEAAIDLAMTIDSGNDEGGYGSSEILWKDPEATSSSQLANELVQLQALGFSQQTLMELYGFSPEGIEREIANKAAEEAAAAKVAAQQAQQAHKNNMALAAASTASTAPGESGSPNQQQPQLFPDGEHEPADD